MPGPLGLRLIFRQFRWRIAITWLLVLLENTLMALIPLFLGRAIDALLSGQLYALWETAGVMLTLVAVASARQTYDTRSFGSMRVRFGAELVKRLQHRPVSQLNARLDMSREMVDFLEGYVPELLTAVVQVIVSIVVLWHFDSRLGLSALGVIVALSAIYALFHQRFYLLNRDLNAQMEQQVSVLEQRRSSSVLSHLKRLRHCEVRLSDTEALLYALIFIAMFAFLLINLWLASSIAAITAGVIFSILSYSWELVESGITLPVVLQQWSRLSEIRERLNQTAEADQGSPE
ncbi:MAG: ABC transporter six-transmembrane domain-containing protein [Cellvibrionaceae bacterium]|nr:ABC transporter six-transmembrane domain-containing protein [Cellvibrionaceae bacterium]